MGPLEGALAYLPHTARHSSEDNRHASKTPPPPHSPPPTPSSTLSIPLCCHSERSQQTDQVIRRPVSVYCTAHPNLAVLYTVQTSCCNPPHTWSYAESLKRDTKPPSVCIVNCDLNNSLPLHSNLSTLSGSCRVDFNGSQFHQFLLYLCVPQKRPHLRRLVVNTHVCVGKMCVNNISSFNLLCLPLNYFKSGKYVRLTYQRFEFPSRWPGN